MSDDNELNKLVPLTPENDDAESVNYLPIDQWDAEKPLSTSSYSRSDTVASQNSDYFTYDEVVNSLEERIQVRLV